MFAGWQVPDYYEMIKNLMDLATMMNKSVGSTQVPDQCAPKFHDDIRCNNAVQYAPDRHPEGK